MDHDEKHPGIARVKLDNTLTMSEKDVLERWFRESKYTVDLYDDKRIFSHLLLVEDDDVCMRFLSTNRLMFRSDRYIPPLLQLAIDRNKADAAMELLHRNTADPSDAAIQMACQRANGKAAIVMLQRIKHCVNATSLYYAVDNNLKNVVLMLFSESPNWWQIQRYIPWYQNTVKKYIVDMCIDLIVYIDAVLSLTFTGCEFRKFISKTVVEYMLPNFEIPTQ